MRFSFMPRKDYKIEPYYFESDESFIVFRDQYGRSYMFAPRKGLRVVTFVVFVFGCIVGRYIMPLFS